MITAIIILAVVFLLGLVGGAAAWSAYNRRQAAKRKEPAKEAAATKGNPFRWKYISVPLAILLLSIVACAYYYHLLPAEVPYHFRADGSPDKWLSRGMTVVWMLVPQILLTLSAGGITRGITKLSTWFGQADSTRIIPGELLAVMGNMLALPQVILAYVMLDILNYSSYQIHLMPLWVFAVIVMGAGGIALGIIFLRAIRRIWMIRR